MGVLTCGVLVNLASRLVGGERSLDSGLGINGVLPKMNGILVTGSFSCLSKSIKRLPALSLPIETVYSLALRNTMKYFEFLCNTRNGPSYVG